MKAITLLQPQKIVFGTGCIQTLVDDYQKLGLKRLFVLTAPPIRPLIDDALSQLQQAGIATEVYQDIVAEPTVNDFKTILEQARRFGADSVIGVGGGSVLDVTKLVATLVGSNQQAVYVSVSGNLAAMFLVELKADAQVEFCARKAVRHGICMVLRSVDPMITIDLMSRLFDIPGDMVKIIPARMHPDYYTETAPVEQLSASMACCWVSWLTL